MVLPRRPVGRGEGVGGELVERPLLGCRLVKRQLEVLVHGMGAGAEVGRREALPMITDPTLIRIGQAVQLNHQGEREAARLEFEAIWDEIGGEQGDPLHVCTLAHAMADAQDDLREELLWDLRALSAADLLTDARMTQAGVGLPAGDLYPSLHLNLSECYRKLGRSRPCP